MVKRRSFTSEFKARVVLEMLSGAKTQAEMRRMRPKMGEHYGFRIG